MVFCACVADPWVLPRPLNGEPVTLEAAERAMDVDGGMTGGPRTMEGGMRSIVWRQAGGVHAAHDRRVVESRIDPNKRNVYEHRGLSRALPHGVHARRSEQECCRDGIPQQTSAVAAGEAHREDVARSNLEGFLLGEEGDGSGVVSEPLLRAHAAQQRSQEAAIEK